MYAQALDICSLSMTDTRVPSTGIALDICSLSMADTRVPRVPSTGIASAAGAPSSVAMENPQLKLSTLTVTLTLSTAIFPNNRLGVCSYE